MSMVMATWGDGNMVVVQDGEVVQASTPAAQKLAEAAMTTPVSEWTGHDEVVHYEPGQPGFTRVALSRLPNATVTGD